MVVNRLRQIRHQMCIDSQTEMARLLGIPRDTYNRIENNRRVPELETALRIARALNMPVEAIWELTE